jgi:hypothetical protein
MKSSYRKVEKHIKLAQEANNAARLSKDPARAKLELGLNAIVARAKKEGING